MILRLWSQNYNFISFSSSPPIPEITTGGLLMEKHAEYACAYAGKGRVAV